MLDGERAKPVQPFDAVRVQGSSDGLAVDPSRDNLREDYPRSGVRKDRPALLVLFQHAGASSCGSWNGRTSLMISSIRTLLFQILITDQTVGLVEAGERVRAIFHQEGRQSLFESTRLEAEVAAQCLVQVDKQCFGSSSSSSQIFDSTGSRVSS